MTDYRNHAWRHHPLKGTDPVDLSQVRLESVSRTAYALKPFVDADLPNDTPVTVNWDNGDESLQYTDNTAPATVDPNFAPFTSDFFAADWQSAPTVAVELNQPGTYLIGASFFIASTSLPSPMPADLWELFLTLSGTFTGGILSAAELSDHRALIDPSGTFTSGSIGSTYMAHTQGPAYISSPPKTIGLTVQHTAGTLSTPAGAAGTCAVTACYLGPFT